MTNLFFRTVALELPKAEDSLALLLENETLWERAKKNAAKKLGVQPEEVMVSLADGKMEFACYDPKPRRDYEDVLISVMIPRKYIFWMPQKIKIMLEKKGIALSADIKIKMLVAKYYVHVFYKGLSREQVEQLEEIIKHFSA